MFGSLGSYLAGLIICAHWSIKHLYGGAGGGVDPNAQNAYILANALYLAALLIGNLAGRVLGLDSLANTSVVFLVLWCSQMMIENCGRGLGFYAVAFTLSVGLWTSAIWLRGHPAFLGAMIGL